MNELLITLALLRGGDMATTQAILARGGIEQNVLLTQHAPVNLALQAGLSVVYTRQLAKLSQTRPRLAKGIAIGTIAFEGWVVAHNARELRR